MNTHAYGGDIGEEARRWILATHDPSFDGWDRLGEWLEQSPIHLVAYNDALDLDDWASEVLSLPPVNDDEADDAGNVIEFAPPARNRRWFLGVGMAAAIVAVMGGWTVMNQINSMQVITAPGQRQTVQLADGSSIILNGGTTIRYDKHHPREVELAAGEALFDVHHDASDPFVVMAGKTRLVDAGTVFNVHSDDGMIDVAVAHGAVIYEPGKADIRLDAGQALYRSARNAEPVLRKAEIETVGEWQRDHLQFDNAPLDTVARDLERNTGIEVRSDPALERLRFTGSLTVSGSPADVFARVGPLLGVRFVADGSAWKMVPANGSRR